jgi:hypothetical protein
MILIEKPQLKFLLAGRNITITSPRQYRKGRSYAVGTRPKKTICRVLILSSSATDDGWKHEIRQHTEDEPRLLARNPGAQKRDYVSSPAEAMRGEQEPIDEITITAFTMLAHARDDARERLSLMSARDRIAYELDNGSHTRIEYARLKRKHRILTEKL